MLPSQSPLSVLLAKSNRCEVPAKALQEHVISDPAAPSRNFRRKIRVTQAASLNNTISSELNQHSLSNTLSDLGPIANKLENRINFLDSPDQSLIPLELTNIPEKPFIKECHSEVRISSALRSWSCCCCTLPGLRQETRKQHHDKGTLGIMNCNWKRGCCKICQQR